MVKNKILVPIMALALAVTAGVNYTKNGSTKDSTFDLLALVKISTANAEDPAPGGEQDGTLVVCPNCGSAGCDGSLCLPEYIEGDDISGCFGSDYGC